MRVATEEEHEIDDANDILLCINMDIDEAGTSSLNRKKDKLVPYEVMRKNNIAENVMKSAVLMPLSKARNI